MELPTFLQIEPVGPVQSALPDVRHSIPAGRSALSGRSTCMEFDTFTRLIDEFVGPRGIASARPRPASMMHPRFFDMVSYAVPVKA